MRSSIKSCLLLITLCLSSTAFSLPIFAAKEHKPCIYCHVNPTPNGIDPATGERESTQRNPRGLYYAAHNLSFAGYNELVVMGKSSPPVFSLDWSTSLPSSTGRIAVTQVQADSAVQLVTLSSVDPKKNSCQINIMSWQNGKFATVASCPVSGSVFEMEVGHFSGDKHVADILTQDGLRTWDGKTFKFYPALLPLSLVGKLRMNNGTERVILRERNGKIFAYTANLKDPTNWLVDPIPVPESSKVDRADLHASPFTLEGIGLPVQMAEGGITDLWDVRHFNKLFLYYVDRTVLKDSAGNPIGKPHDSLVFVDPAIQSLKPIFQTPVLPGAILDVAHHDPKNYSKAGLLILTTNTLDGSGAGLFFYLLD